MTETRSTFGWLRWLAVVLALAALYVITARLGLMLALPPENKATAVWPPSGIALATLLLFGHRIWPGVWLGSFLANLWDGFNAVNPFPLSAHLFVSAGIATGSTLQASAGSFLIRRWTGSVRPFQQATHAFTFAGVAMFVCLIASTLGVASLHLGGFAPTKALAFTWWTWWLGDMTGVLTAGSLLLTWSRLPSLDRHPRRLAEAALLLLLLSVLASVVFGIVSSIALPPPLAYLVIPFLVWATFRFGLHGAATSICLVSAFAVIGTAQGTGPFAQSTVESSLLLLQVFMGVVSVTVLVMAAVLAERQGAEVRAIQWEFVFNEASWAVAVTDPADDTLTAVNPAFAAMHGFTVEELVGRPLADTCSPESRAELPTHVRIAHQRGDYVYESVHVRKDVTQFPCLTHVTTLKDTHGKIQLRAATFEDITERKQAEEALRASEEQFRVVFNQTTGGIAQMDLTGHFTLINDRYCKIVGRSREELMSLRMQDITHPNDLPSNLAQFSALVAGGPSFIVEKRYLRPDGSVVWVHNDVSAIRDREGKVRHIAAAVTDITNRKQAEQALRAGEERFRTLSEAVPAMVWTCLPDGRCDYLSRQWVEYTGIPGADQLGYGWSEAVHPDDRQALLERWQQCVSSGAPLDVEFRIRSQSGEYRWFKTRAIRYHQPDGTEKWFGANIDIHDKMLLETELKELTATLEERVDERTKALQQEEERFRSAFDHAPIGIALVAPDGKWLRVNHSLCDIVGYSEGELLAMDFQMITHPDDLDADLAQVQEMLAGTIGTYQMEKRYFHKDGHVVYVLLSVSLVRDAEGNPLYFISQVEDISQRKQAGRQLMAQDALLRQFIKHSPASIAMFDRGMRYLQASDRWLTDYHLSGRNIIGLSHYDVFPDIPDRWKAIHQRVLAGKIETCDEDPFHRADGSTEWLQWECQPWLSAEGEIGGLIMFTQVITQRKAAESKLAEAHERALATTKAKSEFLATMSHEIRTPMNAIVAMAQLLQDTPLTPDQKNYVGRFSQAADSLMDLLNAILDLSKIEAGYMVLESMPFDLPQLVERLADLMTSKARAKELELLVFVHPDVPQGVVGDPTRLSQVLMNLVGNAIKFTESGHVTITIEPSGDRAPTHALRFSVADSGIGIPSEKLPTVFEPFTQVDSSTTRKYGGTGLGLNISQRIVELMGGRIEVESTPRVGSTFSFTVRMPEASSVGHSPAVPLDLHGRRILVVDDTDTNLMIIREHLSCAGVQILEATSGAQALTLLDEAARQHEAIDLVILDYHMPGMNGLELVQAIRDRQDFSTLPLVMHVSDLQHDDTRRARSLGITSYLYKPLSRRRLMESLATALNPPMPGPSWQQPEAVPERSTLPSCHILLVEDLEDNRDVIALFLKETSYQLDMAENGAVALQKFQTGTYDLVLMDMQMPVMDGLQATMVLRQWERDQQRRPTPIVALTANAFKEEAEKSLGAGCTAHLTKPIKKKTLLTAITQYAKASAEQAA